MKAKQLKRLLALTLAIIFAMPSLTFANLQNHVSNVVIQDISPNNGYKVRLSWAFTESAQAENNQYLFPQDQSTEKHQVKGYRVFGRNATIMENYKRLNNDGEIATSFTFDDLEDASIYSFQIIPYHTHTYKRYDPIIDRDVEEIRDAPYSSEYPLTEVLYMSDINVSAKGSGNRLTVTWDNPTLSGRTVFEGYRIYYQKGGAGVAPNTPFDRNVNVYPNMWTTVADPLRPGINKLSYTIVDDNLEQGATYAVKIEPLVNATTEIRDLPLQNRQVTVLGKTYKIDMKSKTTKEYRTNNASVSVGLVVEEDGKDFVNLIWGRINPSAGTVKRLEVRKSINRDDLMLEQGGKIIGGDLIAAFEGVYANSTHQSRTDKPNQVTYYRVVAYLYDDTRIDSDIAVYDPFQVDVTPLSPRMEVKISNTNDINTKILNVIWEAFFRTPANIFEDSLVDPTTGLIKDMNVMYDMYITDSPANIDNPLMPKVFADKPANTFAQGNMADGKPGFTFDLNKYVAVEKDLFNLYDITTNKTYIIKLVAKKEINKGLTTVIRESQPYYISVTINAQGEIATPPTIGKPPLRITTVTDTSLTTSWNNGWFEVYDTKTKAFHSAVAVRAGQLVFSEIEFLPTDKIVDFAGLKTKEDVVKAFTAAGYADANKLIVRYVQLNDFNIEESGFAQNTKTKFEAKILPYKGLEDIKAAIDPTNPDFDKDWKDLDVELGEVMNYDFKGLTPNTTYVILLRAYRQIQYKRLVGDPAFVIGTTLPTDKEIEIDPTVPNLEGYDTTDTTATVIWEMVTGLSYELSFTNNHLLGAEGGKKIDWETIKETVLIKKGSEIGKDDFINRDKLFYMFTVDHLFPATDYYFWIRAKGTVGGVLKTSNWSNPVLLTTKDLEAPRPPDGLGVAGVDNVNAYNKANGTLLKPVDKNNIIVEWLRDENDTGEIEPGGTDGKGGAGISAKPEFLESLLPTIMTMFSELTPNTNYFFRAKTILTLVQEGELVKRYYHYAVQISKDIDFTDYVEFIVPGDLPESKDEGFIRKESDFCNIVVITTAMTTDEYDGNVNPSLITLPTQDFEIIYDRPTKTLIFRFRSNKKDASGKQDYQVDQRFISELITKRVYEYEVDLSKFGNEVVNNRRLTMPYSIYKAFEERKIKLRIVAGDLITTIAPGSLNTSQVKSLGDFGRDAEIEINFSDDTNINYQTAQGMTTISKKMSAFVTTPSQRVDIPTMAAPMAINLKPQNRYQMMDGNVGVYYRDNGTTNWSMLGAKFNNATGMMETSSAKVGNYGLIVKTVSKPSTGSSESAYVVNSVISFNDLKYYDPKSQVSAMQLNKLMAAMAQNKREVAITAAITEDESALLNKAGLFVSGGAVSREVALSRLIGLYELKTKTRITDYGTIAQNPDIANADARYQASLLKAAKLGYFNGGGVRPKDVMTFGELLDFAAIIVQDAGM